MKFISITKPGIIFGNAVTLTGAFFLGSKGHFHPILFLATLIGMSLVIASGCVFNNYIDRDIDRLMERTKNRVMVQGLISPSLAIAYGILLGLVGFLLLYFFVNPLTTLVALIGFIVYVVIYSLHSKRQSIYGTAIGGIAGALPPVVGYCAATNHFDAGAIILFAILFFWQLPHSYSIAIFRFKDYAAASIPVLPVKKTIHYTKVNMVLCIIAFTAAAVMLTVFGYTNMAYFIVALGLGLIWLSLAIKGFKTNCDTAWSRQMFSLSILNITLLSLVMAIR